MSALGHTIFLTIGGRCLSGFIDWNGKCIQCDKTNGGFLFALLLISWAYVTLFHRLAQSTSSDSRIFLNFGQSDAGLGLEFLSVSVLFLCAFIRSLSFVS